MKRILCGAVFFGFVIGSFGQGGATNLPPIVPSEVSSARIPPQDAVSKLDNVNVRAQPSTSSEIITRLKKGEAVIILEEIKSKKPKKDEPLAWARIAFPSNTPVWINAAYVDPTNKVVRVKKLNVRAGPGENYSVIGLLAKDQTVKEIQQKEGWIEIQAPTNAFAFVALELLTKLEGPTNPPVSVAPSPPVQPPLEVVTNTPEPKSFVPVEPEKTAPVSTVKTEPISPPPVPAPVPTPAVATNPPPAPDVTNAPPAESIVKEHPVLAQKRIVSREGTVRRAYSPGSPAGFVVENPETGLIMDYLYPVNKRIQLKQFLGYRVIVSGEEGLDKQWPATPVLLVETIEFP